MGPLPRSPQKAKELADAEAAARALADAEAAEAANAQAELERLNEEAAARVVMEEQARIADEVCFRGSFFFMFPSAFDALRCW